MLPPMKLKWKVVIIMQKGIFSVDASDNDTEGTFNNSFISDDTDMMSPPTEEVTEEL